MCPITVTFDSNTVERAARPEIFHKDPRQADFRNINAALLGGRIKGYFSETLVTLEGIPKVERAAVLGSTNVRRTRAETIDPETGEATVRLNLLVEQPTRRPLHPGVINRVQAALAVQMRVLGAPRIGFMRIADPDNSIYAQESNQAAVAARLNKFADALRAIESRGLGGAEVRALARTFAQRDGVDEPFFQSLWRARDIHEQRRVERAVAEWADGDSIAAHIAYGVDLFCTEDNGNSANNGKSILSPLNRSWLTKDFGVEFVSLSELAAKLGVP